MSLLVSDLCYRYPSGPLILDKVSFSLSQGACLSILGTNGAGKSTLLNCLAGLLLPDSGEIYLNDRKMSELRTAEIARQIAYVPQFQNTPYSYTVREYVVMGRSPYIGVFSTPSQEDYRIAEESLEKMGISHLREKELTAISGGERQQAMIARALTQQPEIILLDEPTAQLDYGNQYRVVQMVQGLTREGYTVIMTTHNPEHAMMLKGQVAILNREHHFFTGPTEELLKESLLTSLYGLPIRTLYSEEAGRNICFVSQIWEKKGNVE